jgi:hypothetical protein
LTNQIGADRDANRPTVSAGTPGRTENTDSPAGNRSGDVIFFLVNLLLLDPMICVLGGERERGERKVV